MSARAVVSYQGLPIGGLRSPVDQGYHFLVRLACPRAAHNMAAGFSQSTWGREWLRASRTSVTFFCKLISEVTAHHLCHILSVRSKSVGPGLMQGGENYTRTWIPGRKDHWSHFRGCLPQLLRIYHRFRWPHPFKILSFLCKYQTNSEKSELV